MFAGNVLSDSLFFCSTAKLCLSGSDYWGARLGSALARLDLSSFWLPCKLLFWGVFRTSLVYRGWGAKHSPFLSRPLLSLESCCCPLLQDRETSKAWVRAQLLLRLQIFQRIRVLLQIEECKCVWLHSGWKFLAGANVGPYLAVTRRLFAHPGWTTALGLENVKMGCACF